MNIVNSETALLASSSREVTPLPKAPFIGTFMAAFSDEVAVLILMPILPEIMQWYFPEADDVGVYVGLALSIYYFTQFVMAPIWGSFLDRKGRKLTFLLFLTGSCIGVTLAGFSTNFYLFLFSRFLGAIMCIMPVVARAYAGEHSDETNQHRAFAVIGVAGNAAALTAPLMGAFLANPADSFGESFQNDFWREFPYLLSCIVGIVFDLLAIIIIWLWLPESKVWERNREQLSVTKIQSINLSADNDDDDDDEKSPFGRATYQRRKREDSDDVFDAQAENDMMSMAVPEDEKAINFYCLNKHWPESLRTKPVLCVMGTDAAHSMINVIFDAMFAVFCEASIDNGGLGLSVGATGILISIKGLVGFFYLGLIYPFIGGKFGARTAIIWCLLSWIVMLFFFPLISVIMRDSDTDTFAWFLLVCVQITRSIIQPTCNMSLVVVTTNAVHPVALGRMNGLAQSIASFASGVGPFLGGAIWTLSVSSGLPLSNVAVYWSVGVFAMLASYFAFQLPYYLNLPVGRFGRKKPKHGMHSML